MKICLRKKFTQDSFEIFIRVHSFLPFREWNPIFRALRSILSFTGMEVQKCHNFIKHVLIMNTNGQYIMLLNTSLLCAETYNTFNLNPQALSSRVSGRGYRSSRYSGFTVMNKFLTSQADFSVKIILILPSCLWEEVIMIFWRSPSRVLF